MKNPRLVVTNTNGWELADELGHWAKLEIMWQSLPSHLPPDLANNVEQGQILWLKLSDAIHAGERADREDEMRAAAWRKHARKARKKLRRSLRRDGLPNPFEFPELNARELAAWITENRRPDWAGELTDADATGVQDTAAVESAPAPDIPFLLISSAIRRMGAGDWEYDLVPAQAIVSTSDRLTEFREDYNLFLDAAGMGFWIGEAERELSDDLMTFDDVYTQQIRELFDDEPVEAVTFAMIEAAKALPEPFSFGPNVWEETMTQLLEHLQDRWPMILALDEDLDERVELAPEHAEFAVKLGYGLSHAVRALEIPGTRPKQEPASG